MDERPWSEPARQRRSLRTLQSLASAARDLLSERSFEEIRVQDVTARAGVSVGTFYRRFRDKRAILHLVDQDVIDSVRAVWDEGMSDGRLAGKSLEEVVETGIGIMVDQFRTHRSIILQVLRHADPADASAFGERGTAFNRHVHGRFRELLRRHGSEITHPEPELALNMAIFFASSAARDAVWRDNLRTYPVQVDDQKLIREISRAFLRYLTGGDA